MNRTVECWLGLPATQRLPDDAAHCDLWRVAPGVQASLLRGFRDDGLSGQARRALFDVTLPIWRTGEALPTAGRLTSALEADGLLDVGVL